MGTNNRNFQKTIPSTPSGRRELKEELDWLVFKKDKSPKSKG